MPTSVEDADERGGRREGSRSERETAALRPKQIMPRRRDILETELRH
jgi:hypothetical protein